jgi:RNA polymerase sigma-70 factor (ECF subfamily)
MNTPAAPARSTSSSALPPHLRSGLGAAVCPDEGAGPTPVAWRDVVALRPHLVRYAQRRLHDPMLAEDVVHDVFEAVLCGRARFDGRSALRTWLTGVLKHKIVDLIRQRAGVESLDAEDDGEEPHRGSQAVCPLPGPEHIAEQRERLGQTLARIEALPSGLRDVMHLRVLHEQSTDAVCRTLGITEDNLFVRLHRARRQLLS